MMNVTEETQYQQVLKGASAQKQSMLSMDRDKWLRSETEMIDDYMHIDLHDLP